MELQLEKKLRKVRRKNKYLYKNHMFKTVFHARTLTRIPLNSEKLEKIVPGSFSQSNKGFKILETAQKVPHSNQP